jgi:hypothetical protein
VVMAVSQAEKKADIINKPIMAEMDRNNMGY